MTPDAPRPPHPEGPRGAPPVPDLPEPPPARDGAEGFEYFDVAADVGVEAWGPDLVACFRQCGLGVFNLMAPVDRVAAAEHREVSAQGETREALLVNWVNDLLYLHDVEGFVIRDLEVRQTGEDRIHAVLAGEPFDPARHPRGTLVKAATFHQVAVVEAPGQARARLILDI